MGACPPSTDPGAGRWPAPRTDLNPPGKEVVDTAWRRSARIRPIAIAMTGVITAVAVGVITGRQAARLSAYATVRQSASARELDRGARLAAK